MSSLKKYLSALSEESILGTRWENKDVGGMHPPSSACRPEFAARRANPQVLDLTRNIPQISSL